MDQPARRLRSAASAEAVSVASAEAVSDASPEAVGVRLAVGARLRAARQRARLTQEEVAAHVGRKKNWLSDIERGRRGIDVGSLQRIADLLGRSIEFFTNPQFAEERRRRLFRPATREDWELLYEGEVERTAAHAALDDAFARARRLVQDSAPPDPAGR